MPMTIVGAANPVPVRYALPVASAQVKSAVLLAGLFARGTTIVREPAPTRDHTERMLAAFGVAIECVDRRISIAGGQRLRATNVTVPTDISSAAFFIIGAAIAALCCFTPILVLLLGVVGLSAVLGMLDYVLLPALIIFVGIIVYALLQQRRS